MLALEIVPDRKTLHHPTLGIIAEGNAFYAVDTSMARPDVAYYTVTTVEDNGYIKCGITYPDGTISGGHVWTGHLVNAECKCCSQLLELAWQGIYEMVGPSKYKMVDGYTIATCRTKECALEGATAELRKHAELDVQRYAQVVVR